ncbi:hypothetical protein Bbelb_022540 [Branchiostoma belcheri]|nr:hypothetical protein Bbelb_022540 [Branchiostoma belcheri]
MDKGMIFESNTESLAVLLIQDKYNTSQGEITINPKLGKVFKENDIPVISTVLQASEQDKQDAQQDGVELLLPRLDPDDPRTDPSLAWLTFDHHVKYPHLPQRSDALDIPEDTEYYKGDEKAMGIGKKEDSILEDAQEADVVFSLGNKIFDHFENQFRAIPASKRPRHVKFVPRPSKIFEDAEVEYKDTETMVVLSIGRVKGVEKLKGYDLAAETLSIVAEKIKIKWHIIGFNKDDFEATKAILEHCKSANLQVTFLPYGTQKDICKEMMKAHLVLMPSRAEPFGLVGLEAIAAGVPVLVSSKSGLADFIHEHVDELHHSIVDMDGSDERATVKLLAQSIERMLKHNRAEFKTAARGKQQLLSTKYWEEFHLQFIKACTDTGKAEEQPVPVQVQSVVQSQETEEVKPAKVTTSSSWPPGHGVTQPARAQKRKRSSASIGETEGSKALKTDENRSGETVELGTEAHQPAQVQKRKRETDETEDTNEDRKALKFDQQVKLSITVADSISSEGKRILLSDIESDDSDTGDLDVEVKRRTVRTSSVPADMELTFEKVIDSVSHKWKDLARKLGFSKNERKRIRTDEPDQERRCREMLWRWRSREGREATLQVLKQALIDIDERRTASRLTESLEEFQLVLERMSSRLDKTDVRKLLWVWSARTGNIESDDSDIGKSDVADKWRTVPTSSDFQLTLERIFSQLDKTDVRKLLRVWSARTGQQESAGIVRPQDLMMSGHIATGNLGMLETDMMAAGISFPVIVRNIPGAPDKFKYPRTSEAPVGPEGGQVEIPGFVKLVVPQGVLQRETTITVSTVDIPDILRCDEGVSWTSCYPWSLGEDACPRGVLDQVLFSPAVKVNLHGARLSGPVELKTWRPPGSEGMECILLMHHDGEGWKDITATTLFHIDSDSITACWSAFCTLVFAWVPAGQHEAVQRAMVQALMSRTLECRFAGHIKPHEEGVEFHVVCRDQSVKTDKYHDGFTECGTNYAQRSLYHRDNIDVSVTVDGVVEPPKRMLMRADHCRRAIGQSVQMLLDRSNGKHVKGEVAITKFSEQVCHFTFWEEGDIPSSVQVSAAKRSHAAEGSDSGVSTPTEHLEFLVKKSRQSDDGAGPSGEGSRRKGTSRKRHRDGASPSLPATTTRPKASDVCQTDYGAGPSGIRVDPRASGSTASGESDSEDSDMEGQEPPILLGDQRPIVLLINDEYGTSKGGISTINCQASQTLQGKAVVYCTVLQRKVPKQDQEAADRDGVTLIGPDPRGKKTEPTLDWLTDYHNRHFPSLPKDVTCIIGHANITDKAARNIKDERYPHADLITFTHVIPEDTKYFKGGQKAMEASEIEKDMLEQVDNAKAAFSVGERIYKHFIPKYGGDKKPREHHLFFPRPSKLFEEVTIQPKSGEGELVVLSIGRVKNVENLKGYNLAARAIKIVRKYLEYLRWVTRGISKDDWEESLKILETNLNSGDLMPTLRPYGTQEDIRNDMMMAHLVLMPSRSEPFGLVGLEAIAAGIPVLISDKSGLADMIKKLIAEKKLPRGLLNRIVETSVRDSDMDNTAEKWADKITETLNDTETAFTQAKKFKDALLESKYWGDSEREFLRACGITDDQQTTEAYNTTDVPEVISELVSLDIRELEQLMGKPRKRTFSMGSQTSGYQTGTPGSGPSRPYSPTGNKTEQMDIYCKLGDLHREQLHEPQESHKYYTEMLALVMDLGRKDGESQAYNRLGRAHYDMGEHEESLKWDKKCLKMSQESGDKTGQITEHKNIADSYRALGKLDLARSHYQSAMTIAMETGNKTEQMDIYFKLGDLHRVQLHEPQESHKYYTEMLELARDLGRKEEEGLAYNRLGRAHYAMGEFEESLEWEKKGLKMRQESGDKTEQITAHKNIADSYTALGKLDLARSHYQSAMTIAMETGNKTEQMDIYCKLGDLHRVQLHEPQESHKYYTEMLALARDLGRKEEEGLAYNRLGLLHYDMGEHEESLKWYKKDLKMRQESGDKTEQITEHKNIAVSYTALGKLDLARSHYKSAMTIAMETGNKTEQMGIYFKLGDLHVHREQLHEPQESHKYYTEMLALVMDLGRKDGESQAYNRLGLAHYDMGEHEESLEWYKKNLKMSQESGDKTGQITAHQCLAASYKVLGKLDLARSHYQSAMTIAMETGNKQKQEDIAKELANL